MSRYLNESNLRWGYAEHPDCERWYNADSLADAVQKAEELAADLPPDVDGASAYIVAGALPDPGLIAEDALTMYGIEDLMERMDEHASENACYAEDEQFVAQDGAEEALKELLRWWGRRYVKATIWTSVGEPIRITRAR